jgi:hypothetical protein
MVVGRSWESAAGAISSAIATANGQTENKIPASGTYARAASRAKTRARGCTPG